MFVRASMAKFSGKGVSTGDVVKINPNNILYLEDMVCPINRVAYTKIHFNNGQSLSIADSSQEFENKLPRTK